MAEAGDRAGRAWTEPEVRAAARSLVLRLAPEGGADREGSLRLVDDLAYHSVAVLELAFAVEEAFGLSPMDLQTASAIHTTDDLEAFVLGRLRQASRLRRPGP
ncbi:MAG TPA: acyl carrier protein [Longimicrobium sp.]|jgi:acyl carrier protein